MEMVDRYIYAVIQRLPQPQREDIAEELRSLIEDMLEERVHGRGITNKDEEEVLMELGNPKHLAQKYRGGKRYLISPEYFDSYMLVLKIVLASVVLSISAGFIIQIIIDPIAILDHFIEFIVSFVTSVPMAFGWTTFGFALGEYIGVFNEKGIQIDEEWKPSDLAAIPDPKRRIKRGESIFGIIFYVVFIVILAFSNDYFGVWLFQEGEFSGIVPFLNEETYVTYLLFIITILGFGILKECFKLIYAKWTYKLVTFTAVINLVSLAVVMLVITGPEFWNPNFMNELVQNTPLTIGSESYGTISKVWEQSTRWILIFLVFGLIWDVIAGFIKSRK